MGASSNRTGLSYVKESVWGQNPGTTLQDINFEGESLTNNVEYVTSNSIRSDRQTTDLIQTGSSCSGGFNFELQYGAYDDFILAALFASSWAGVGGGTTESITSGASGSNLEFSLNATANTITFGSSVTHGIVEGQWFELTGSATDDGFHQATDVTGQVITVSSITTTETLDDTDAATIKGSMARNGTNMDSFYVERSHEDISQFFQFSGLVINSMSLDFSANAVLKGSFDFVGKDETLTQTTGGTGSNTAAVDSDIMNAVSNVGSILIDGSAAPSCLIQKISMEIGNNIRGQNAVGTLGFCDVVDGELSVKGSLDILDPGYTHSIQVCISCLVDTRHMEGIPAHRKGVCYLHLHAVC